MLYFNIPPTTRNYSLLLYYQYSMTFLLIYIFMYWSHQVLLMYLQHLLTCCLCPASSYLPSLLMVHYCSAATPWSQCYGYTHLCSYSFKYSYRCYCTYYHAARAMHQQITLSTNDLLPLCYYTIHAAIYFITDFWHGLFFDTYGFNEIALHNINYPSISPIFHITYLIKAILLCVL